MRVIITGGAGRLGITICQAFLKDGFQVRVFDLDTPDNRKSVKELRGKAEIFWGDITQPHLVREAMENVDAVVHMAAILPPVAHEKPELAHKVNVKGTSLLVDIIKEKGSHIPFVFTSSAAVFGPSKNTDEPISPEKHECYPNEAYGQTKLQAENLIKESGIDYLVLRLTATMYFIFKVSDLKRMFTVPLDNRIEYCHPHDTALAIVNAVKKFDVVKGNTLVISGGPKQRMLYRDMIKAILGVMALPLPPASKFTKKSYYLDWYDTTKSQLLLRFQGKSFDEYISDFSQELTRRYTRLFLPFMRYFAGPLFGKLIVKLM